MSLRWADLKTVLQEIKGTEPKQANTDNKSYFLYVQNLRNHNLKKRS